MRQLTSLDAQFLGVETARTYGHVGGLAVYDPSTAPGGDARDRRRLPAGVRAPAPAAAVPLAARRACRSGSTSPTGSRTRTSTSTSTSASRRVPPPGDDRQLAETVARIFARPLDRSRPLWELYLIHGLPSGRVALLTKIHHAVVDGVSGNEILGVLLDPSPEGRRSRRRRSAPRGERVPGDLEMLGRGLLGRPAPAAARAALAPDGAAEPDRPAGRQRVPGRCRGLRRASRGCGARPAPTRTRRARGHDRAARRRRASTGRVSRAPPLRVRLALARHASSGSRTSSASPSTTSSWRCARPRCATGCSPATSCRRSRWWR